MSAPVWVVIQYLFRIGPIKDLSHPYRIVQRLDSNTIWPTNELSLSWCMLASISLDSLCNLSAFVCRPWLVFSPYTHSFLMFFAQIPIGVPSRNPVLPGERIDFAKSKIGIIWCYQCLHTNAISNMCTVNLLVIHNFTFKTYLLPPKMDMKPRKTALLNSENPLNQTVIFDHFWVPAVHFQGCWQKKHRSRHLGKVWWMRRHWGLLCKLLERTKRGQEWSENAATDSLCIFRYPISSSYFLYVFVDPFWVIHLINDLQPTR